MERRIAYYVTEKNGPWPTEIQEKFSKYISKFGIPYFEDGSLLEKEFAIKCETLGIKLYKYTELKCEGADLYKQPFHYLSTVEGKVKDCDDSFMDYSNACNKCGFGSFRIGARQIRKVKLNSDKTKPYDIFDLPLHRRPRIFIISKRLRNLMEPMNLTGVMIVPCLDKTINYTSDEEDFSYNSEKLAAEAKYFQLIITAKVNNPPYVGKVKIVQPSCSECQTYTTFLISRTPCFRIDDLKEQDFQYYDQYNSENLGLFYISNDIPIISSRVIKLFIENKVKLFRYMTDPPIKFGIVEMC